MTDTTLDAAAVVRAAILKTAPAERIRHALELSEQVRALSLSRLRRLHPERSTIELVELLTGEILIPSALRGDGNE